MNSILNIAGLQVRFIQYASFFLVWLYRRVRLREREKMHLASQAAMFFSTRIAFIDQIFE